MNALVIGQVFYLLNSRYKVDSPLSVKAHLDNPYVGLGIGAVVVARGPFTYAPPFHALFHTEARRCGISPALPPTTIPWMAVVYGFARYRWRMGKIEFAPILPTRARRLCIPILLRGSLLEIDIEQDRVTYRLRSGNALTAHHFGQEFTVSVGSPISFAGRYRTHDGQSQPDALGSYGAQYSGTG